MEKIAFLAMDVHACNCVLGHMRADGSFLGNKTFKTSERNIVDSLKAIRAEEKYLAIEESNLAYWVCQVAKPWVTEVISSDPKENALIYKSPNKRDQTDTQKLCRLLRMGELKRVYQPESDDRAIFKASVQHYIDLRDQQTRIKNKIKATYRHWGVIDITGEAVYGTKHRHDYQKKIKHPLITDQLDHLYELMDKAELLQQQALKSVKQSGRKYPEIKEFKKVPGIGDILAHIFDAFIQTPERFSNKRALWRYCRLGVTDRSSDGKPLGYKRLDRSGVAELKSLPYQAWLSAMRGDNEVKRFHKDSVRRTSSRVHARLNTERKILAVLYGLWKTGEPYNPKRFLDPSESGVV